MATANGTATDYLDLLDKFNTFVTGLSGGAAWTALRNTSTEKIWSAPGGGSDQIIVGIKTFFNAGADYYNYRLGGFLAFDSALAFEVQSGYVGTFMGSPSPSPVLNLWNSSIPYRFYGNGKRAIILAKVSSVYVTAYLGFLNAYISPGSWPYPLIVGGSMAWQVEPGATDARWRWSYTGDEMANFPIPRSSQNIPYMSTFRLRRPDGTWIGLFRTQRPNQPNVGKVWPYGDMGNGAAIDWRSNLDGSYRLLPIVATDTIPNVYGELDGIYALTGFGNSSENIVNDGTDDHYVVQNVFRSDQADFFAIKEA